MHSYVLQEVSVSDQLFQSSENTLDDLVWTADSIFSSKKVTVISLRFHCSKLTCHVHLDVIIHSSRMICQILLFTDKVTY